MNWVVSTFRSSIGKKLIMAITGLSFCAFLATHLVGNLFYFKGKEGFEAYTAQLHEHIILLRIAEGGLIFLALLHILLGAVLYIQNFRARPQRYAVTKSIVRKNTKGGQTLSSRLMPYTGLYILAFVIIHLFAFTFIDKTAAGGLYGLVTTAFHSPSYVGFYVFTMIVVGLHIRHGFWSAFQTLGLNHPKYMPAIRVFSVLYAIVIVLCFSSIPAFIYLRT